MIYLAIRPFNFKCLYSLRSQQFVRFLSKNVKEEITPTRLTQHLKIKPVTMLTASRSPGYVTSPHSKLQSLIWNNPIRNVLITKKPGTDTTREAMVKFITHLHDSYPEINVIVQPDVVTEISDGFKTFPEQNPNHPHVLFTGKNEEIVTKTDLLVTLGGDGTILHAVSMFHNMQVPPVLAFSLGTLGFLLPFDFSEHETVFNEVMHSRAKCLHRTRLECFVVRKNETKKLSKINSIHAMNDIFLHRGNAPHLAYLDVFIDGEYLTRTTADGVALATPTGSTAYSLSAGGSIVSPLVPCILLTPICPRSLSFRPLILPHSSHVKIKVTSKSNYNIEDYKINLSIDGRPNKCLNVGDEIHVVNETGTIYVNGSELPPEYNTQDIFKRKSKIKYSGIYCIAKTENDWSLGINELLGFNSSFRFNAPKNGTKSTKIDDEQLK